MSGSFDDIELTTRKSSLIQERMSLVSSHMYKQFLEYQQSNINTSVLFDKMVENMAITVDYLKQSFSSRGLPAENIYYEYDKAKHIAVMNILWHPITFFANMKDSPKALPREKDVPIITGRIIAIKGLLPELAQGYNEEIEKKLLKMEVASIFIPADKNAQAIIKFRRVTTSQDYINQVDAPRDFLVRVVESVCGGGNIHTEGSTVTFSI